MHSIRNLHRLALDRGDLPLLLLSLLLRSGGLRRGRVVGGWVDLLDGGGRSFLRRAFSGLLGRFLGFGGSRGLGFGEDILAEVLDKLQRSLAVDLE